MMITVKQTLPGGLLAGVLLVLCFSCSQPYIPAEENLEPPENVTVDLVGGTMRITWDNVNQAEGYEVLRKEGRDGFRCITSGPVTENQYHDDTYNPRQTLQYTVRCCRRKKKSKPSLPTIPISRYVQELTASRFEYSQTKPAPLGGQIVLSWKAHLRGESYVVSRYLSKADDQPRAEFEVNTTFFEDVHSPADQATIQPGVPYYYRVAWSETVNGTREVKGADGPFSLGVFTQTVDYCEPNDEVSMLFGQTVSSIFNPLQPELIYSFGDNQSGDISADADWYKYYGPPAGFNVSVQLPPGTPFLQEELYFRFYYAGRYYTPVALYKNTGSINPNTFLFDDFGGSPDELVSVYFSVYPLCASSRDVYGTYIVELSSEF